MPILIILFPVVVVGCAVWAVLAFSGELAESEDRHATGVWLPQDEQGQTEPTVVCAYCPRDRQTVIRAGGAAVSHGICRACLDIELTKVGGTKLEN